MEDPFIHSAEQPQGQNRGEKPLSVGRIETVNSVPSEKDAVALAATVQAQGSSDSCKPENIDTASQQKTPQADPHRFAISDDKSRDLNYYPHSRVSRAFKPSSYSERQWGIHWYKPTVMIFLSLCGLLAALGHHLYNASLHGKTVGNVEWPQRLGTAFGFFVKMVLVNAVTYAYHQRAWLTVRKKSFRVETLDCIFSVSSPALSPSDFLLIQDLLPPAMTLVTGNPGCTLFLLRPQSCGFNSSGH